MSRANSIALRHVEAVLAVVGIDCQAFQLARDRLRNDYREARGFMLATTPVGARRFAYLTQRHQDAKTTEEGSSAWN